MFGSRLERSWKGYVVVVALAGTAVANELIVDPSFEISGQIEVAEPATPGTWGGDQSLVVSAQQGVSPRSGGSMLRFEAAAVSGAGATTSSNVYQLFDLSPFLDLVQAGSLQVEVAVYCNRVAGDTETDSVFRIGVQAHTGELSDFPSNWPNYMLRCVGELESDSDPSTWELVSCSMQIPPTTRYLAVDMRAFENRMNDVVYPEFDGHYVDDVSLRIPDLPLRADLNRDGCVDLTDLAVLLGDFGCSSVCAGDTDGDRDTDLSDLAEILADFGRGC